jgi:GNAT superfamily N-acetyltransferase
MDGAECKPCRKIAGKAVKHFNVRLKKYKTMHWQKDEFILTTAEADLDIPYIHAFLSQRSYWAEGIPLETVKASIEGSVCFGIYQDTRQVGFARVITDKATFGYLADVFVDEGLRGRGLSKWMMEAILAHPQLQGFRNWMLATRDAQGLYARFGFRPLDTPERIMRRNNPDVYRKKQ